MSKEKLAYDETIEGLNEVNAEPETPQEATQEAAPAPRQPRILWTVIHCDDCAQLYQGQIADTPKVLPPKMGMTMVAGGVTLQEIGKALDVLEVRFCNHAEKALRERFSGFILRLS